MANSTFNLNHRLRTHDRCTDPNVDSRRRSHYALLDRATWDCPPSRGCVMDTREKESPLIILRPEGRGPIRYSGLGKRETVQYGPHRPVTGADQFLEFFRVMWELVKAKDLVDLSGSDIKGTSIFRPELPEIRRGRGLRLVAGRAGVQANAGASAGEQANASERAGCRGRADVHAGVVRGARHKSALRQTCASGRARASPSVWTGRLVTGALFTREHDPNLKW
ncbi:hypothetical protein CRG98_030324 [Punica granatum]|uniref:Uncharacterized protein n=1 Tax=Punica granatum TaxID=22663 RepID=A0A2I0IZ56_PUNGR|nr:hypothetical protein CRG98_030324 [Punica granatum]